MFLLPKRYTQRNLISHFSKIFHVICWAFNLTSPCIKHWKQVKELFQTCKLLKSIDHEAFNCFVTTLSWLFLTKVIFLTKKNNSSARIFMEILKLISSSLRAYQTKRFSSKLLVIFIYIINVYAWLCIHICNVHVYVCVVREWFTCTCTI